MISFGNAASSHSGLIPLKTAYKKRGELLWAIARKKNFINLYAAAFDTMSHFSKNRSINFFTNSTIPRSIVKKYSLQVSGTLKTGKALKQGLKYNQFSPQILCLHVSVLIIHQHCFQVSYARAQLEKDINLHQKELLITFRRNIRNMQTIGLSSQIAVRAETVNVTAHRVGCNTLLSYSGYNTTETLTKSCSDVIMYH